MRRLVGPERRRVWLVGEFVNLQAPEIAVGQPGLIDRGSGRLFVAEVEINLTARAGVVVECDDRLVAGMRVGDGILEVHIAEPGQFIAVAVLGAADDVRKGATFGHLLTVHEDTPTRISEARIRIEERSHVREISRAEAGEIGGFAGQPLQVDVLDLIGCVQYLQRRAVDDQAGYERAGEAMVAHGAFGGEQFVIHQHRKSAIAVVESAEAIGNAHHAPGRDPVGFGADWVARREERFERHGGVDMHQVGSGRARRPLGFARNDELRCVQVGNVGVLHDHLVAARQRQYGIMAGLLERVQHRLPGGEAVVAHVDMVASLQLLNVIATTAVAEHDRAVLRTPDQSSMAEAAYEQATSGPAVKFVLAGAAGEPVVALIAEQLVVAVAALEEVIAAPAMQRVIALVAEYLVIAAAAEQRIVTVATLYYIVSAATECDVVSLCRGDVVVAVEAKEEIVLVRSRQNVVALGTKCEFGWLWHGYRLRWWGEARRF